MRVCIPVEADLGLESSVCGHFGSAPAFLIVDSESLVCTGLPNRQLHHEHGQCRPLDALAGQVVDAMIVGGIGAGALYKLQAAGVRVYRSTMATVKDAISALREGTLLEVDPRSACSHHGHG